MQEMSGHGVVVYSSCRTHCDAVSCQPGQQRVLIRRPGSLRLKLAKIAGPRIPEKNKKALSESKPFVLVVDDDPAVLRIIKSFLEQNDYLVKTALSGEEAFGILLSETPSVLILDVMMPGASGYDICRLIKRDVRLKNVPVVFLTSKSEPKDFKTGHDLGAVIYMSKPFKVQKLFHVIQMLCPVPGQA
jgi:CheY-like chemotaxis protein